MTKVTLKAQVQTIRDEAKVKLQLRMTSVRMVKISNNVRTLASLEKNLETIKKELKLAEYNVITKLDENHPDAEARKEAADKKFEMIKKELEADTKSTEKSIEDTKKASEEMEKEIVEIEEGKKKIGLDRLNEEVASKIENL